PIAHVQMSTMPSGQFAGQVEADPVTRGRGGSRAMMKPFKNIFARRNGATSVADRQHHIAAVAVHADPNSSAGTIVLPRVLQEVLHDERRVTFFAGHKKTLWKFLFNLHIRRIWQRTEIVHPFINKLAKIDGRRCDSKVTGVHARQQKQILNYASQPTSLMEQSG